ncbi:LysR family transcriptional regulator [Shimwellia pseudoproteus]|nr:LysR family transcriptional regulator [Shimwellia pseudoproteus]
MVKKATDELGDLKAFATVAAAGGFREAARQLAVSPSGLSAAVRRLENRLAVRLLHRTTRSVLLTEQGKLLLERIEPAIAALDAALELTLAGRDSPAGLLRLNVPVNTARLWLPQILPGFLARYPDIRVEVTAQSEVVDLLSAGCDAGIRYGEWLEQDMIAIPVGPREQRFATAAAPAYLDHHGRPQHPDDLRSHACLSGRFSKGNLEKWVYQQGEDIVTVVPSGPIIYSAGSATDMAVEAAISGLGVIYLFEEWLQPHIASGALEPVLEPWWQRFPGPWLYYSGRKLVPPPLRAFIEFIKTA